MSHLNPFNTPFDGTNEINNTIAPSAQPDPQRLTQWPSIPAFPTPPLPPSAPTSSRKPSKRHSVQKPTPIRKKSRARQKEQNARAGIKVITNFSRHTGPTQQVRPQPEQPSVPKQATEAPRFVDLAALQALEPAQSNNGGFWNMFWSSNNRAPAQQATDSHETGLTRGLGSWSQHERSETSLGLRDDLSPNDRPIMIGLTIPHNTMGRPGTSPNTAGTEASIIQAYTSPSPGQHMPGTPDIVITPAAAEVSYWSPDTATAVTPQSRRIPSSLYSRPAASSYYAPQPQPSNAPPVPEIPQSVLDSNTYRDSVDTIFDDDDEAPIAFKKKSRILSSGTMFEEDQSPILTRQKRTSSLGSRLKIKTSLSPNDNRTSFGWWNTIVSPFIPTPRVPRSSTFLSPNGESKEEQPPLPNIQSTIKKNNSASEPEKPMSPLSATTIASDVWWDKRDTYDSKFDWEAANRKEKDGVHRHGTKESVSTQNGTLPFMLGETLQNELGLAAEANARRQREQENSQEDHSTPSPISGHGPITYPTYQTTTPPAAYTPWPAPAATPSRKPATSGGPLHLQLATMSSQAPEMPTHSFDARSSSITPSVAPPPYSAAAPRFKAIYPPNHVSALQPPPQSPGPVSPGLQQAMTSTGAIAMQEVPLTPAPGPRRVINLNSGYPTALPPRVGNTIINPVDLERESDRARKIETKRQRLEKEDALARKAGGLWRGRACVPQRGCFGRGGSEGRRRRRCWLGGIGIFVFLIVLVVVLVTQLRQDSADSPQVPTQWVNLTAFPPIVTGVATVAAPDNTVENTGCVYPKTVWSCSLPKELQSSVAPSKPNQPNFKWLIQWDNSSSANATWGGPLDAEAQVQRAGNPVSARALVRRLILEATAVVFSSNPLPPDVKEIAFLSNTTDAVLSDSKEGEATPFYISFLDPLSESNALSRADLPDADADTGTSIALESRQSRSNTTEGLPDTGVPAPEFDTDGTAMPANLFPTALRQQPLRLFDRGLSTEHFGFYSYFTRSIFLKSTALLNSTNAGDGEVLEDRNGGCTEKEARSRCSWPETRVLVQIWTNRGPSAQLLGNVTALDSQNATEVATNFAQPGSFPYPVTIKLDRHGGDPVKKGIYCYDMDERSRPVKGSGKIRLEFRGFGGQLVNKAPSAVNNDSDPSLGGFDGGNSGCACEWQNFKGVI